MKNLFEVLKSWERQGKPGGAFYSYTPRFLNKEDVCGPFPIEELLDEDVVALFVEFEKTEYLQPKEIWVEGCYSVALLCLFSGQEVECQHLSEPEPWGSPDELHVKNLQHYRWRWKDKEGFFNEKDWAEKVKKMNKYELTK